MVVQRQQIALYPKHGFVSTASTRDFDDIFLGGISITVVTTGPTPVWIHSSDNKLLSTRNLGSRAPQVREILLFLEPLLLSPHSSYPLSHAALD